MVLYFLKSSVDLPIAERQKGRFIVFPSVHSEKPFRILTGGNQGQFGDWVTLWNISNSSRTCGQWQLGHKILKTFLPSLFYLSGHSQGNRLFSEQRICEDLDNLTLPFQQVKSYLLHQIVLRGPCCDLTMCLCICLRWWAGGFYKSEHPWQALHSS